MAGVGRKLNASMSRGRIDASACPSDLVWNKEVKPLARSPYRNQGCFRPRRLSLNGHLFLPRL